MKKSETPTNYILVPAYTSSEWDNANAALISLTPELRKRITKYAGIAQQFKNDIDFRYLKIHDCVEAYFVDDENDSLNNMLVNKGNSDWVFVDIEGEEFPENLFSKPEAKVEAQSINFDNGGNFYYNGYGKYSNDEFYTSEINIVELFKQIDNKAVVTNF